MTLTKTCKLTITKPGRQAYTLLPFNARFEFGKKSGALHIHGTLGGVPYRGRLVTVEKDKQALFINRDVLDALGFAGQDLTVYAVLSTGDPAEDVPIRPEVVETCGMDVLQAITGRASVRRYTDEPVSEEHLTTILNAGFCAPTASGKRPWEFIVVRDKKILAALADASRYAKPVAGAPLAIVVCGDGVRQSAEEFILEDGAAAIQNMLLAAHGLGLGAVWCGVWRGSSIRKGCIELFGLPVKMLPMGLIAIGHPAEEKRQPARYVPGRVHWNHW